MKKLKDKELDQVIGGVGQAVPKAADFAELMSAAESRAVADEAKIATARTAGRLQPEQKAAAKRKEAHKTTK